MRHACQALAIGLDKNSKWPFSLHDARWRQHAPSSQCELSSHATSLFCPGLLTMLGACRTEILHIFRFEFLLLCTVLGLVFRSVSSATLTGDKAHMFAAKLSHWTWAIQAFAACGEQSGRRGHSGLVERPDSLFPPRLPVLVSNCLESLGEKTEGPGGMQD